MDYMSIILGTTALAALVGFAWIGGYEVGQSSGIDAERQLANRRVNALLEELNKYKPKLRYRSVNARTVGKRRAGK
jgi:hypothetical protein